MANDDDAEIRLNIDLRHFVFGSVRLTALWWLIRNKSMVCASEK